MEINLIKELHGQLDTSADSADMFQRGTESGRISNNRDKIFFFFYRDQNRNSFILQGRNEVFTLLILTKLRPWQQGVVGTDFT